MQKGVDAVEEGFWTGHRGRLRNRARSEGVENLRPHEVIELLLYQGMPRTDMQKAARALIDRFGTVQGVLLTEREELLSVKGMTSQAAEWVMRTGNLLRVFEAADQLPMLRIWRVKDLIRYLAPIWPTVKPPQTWMLYTDYEDRLLMQSVLCDSLYWADPMMALEILREAMSLQASHAFIVCFAGVEPLELMESEREFFGQLSETLRAVGVELLDCMMVGEAGYFSLNQSGGMDDIRQRGAQPWLHERYIREDDDDCGESPNSCG